MKPWTTLDEARAPDGGKLSLQRRDDEFVLRVGGHVLMSSRTHGSEVAMARAALEGLGARSPRVLVGGLGMGFTLRAVLDLVSAASKVVVAELIPAVIAWNRGPLAPLAQSPLSDPRVTVHAGDVSRPLGEANGSFDAILLDVDNGPSALTRPQNARLYGSAGLSILRHALRSGGRLVVWSAGPDAAFKERLVKSGFAVDVRSVAAFRPGAGPKHILFIATPAARKRAASRDGGGQRRRRPGA